MYKLTVSVSPHIKDRTTVSSIMWGVVVALLPTVLWGVFYFQMGAVYLISTCVVTAVVMEAFFQKITGKIITVSDGSAFLTGLLLALILPPTFPLWAAALGAVVAVILGKQLFGGLGYNIFNPALLGRAFLSTAFPVLTTTWKVPRISTPQLVARGDWTAFFIPDTVTQATPLATVLPKFGATGGGAISYFDLFVGRVSGCLGEVSAVALIVGAIYLVWRKYIDWRIPLSYIGTVVVVASFTSLFKSGWPSPLFHLLSGGLMLGALFMATDPVTSPITKKGRWIFGIGAGVLTISIRLLGGYPEGVMYSILIMNAFTPLIDRLMIPAPFGGKRR
ncbi:MAG TPA: RnfABCDGE type electron transport complex subunit D [Candidatus Omnitrophica bacterium]|nr:RnfABCDGE type electron transport complex subunit D [Candidatus Omnitrophota bacterium]